jgi:hypothetical protein
VRTAQRYADALQRTHNFDAEMHLPLTFLSDSFLFPSLTITKRFRARRQLELFFGWI